VDPYGPLRDESEGLGAVDPVTFPAENLGTDGNRMMPGNGSFVEIPAVVNGEAVGYFAYPVKTPRTRDPLRLLEDGKPYAPVATPTAYAFDVADGVAVPDVNKCSPPDGYQPDKRLDPVPGFYMRQGAVFTALPAATYTAGALPASTYVPVVAEATASSGGKVCQSLKSEKGITTVFGKAPQRTGNYLAWLIIDPAAAVYPIDDPMMESPGIATQKWGWYNRYLLAYLDGGYIPTAESMITEGPMDAPVMKTVLRMVPQKLYYPRTPVLIDDMPTPVTPGMGLDVLSAKRGTDGYSPICEVWSYSAGMAPVPPEMLPTSAMAIEAAAATTMPMPATPRFIYCLQVR
jgi:hypothetical protein